MQRMNLVVTVVMVAALATGCSNEKRRERPQAASRPEPSSVATSGTTDLPTQDAKDFISHVASVNEVEIQLGKLALSRGTAAEVRTFGQMMVDDHTSAAARLDTVEKDLRLEPARQLDSRQADLRDKIAKQSGSDFDREYAKAMVDGHQDLLDQLESRVDKKGLDQWKVEMKGKTRIPAGGVAILPDKSDNKTTMRVNQFAASLYPTVYAHLQSAKALEESLKRQGNKRR